MTFRIQGLQLPFVASVSHQSFKSGYVLEVNIKEPVQSSEAEFAKLWVLRPKTVITVNTVVCSTLKNIFFFCSNMPSKGPDRPRVVWCTSLTVSPGCWSRATEQATPGCILGPHSAGAAGFGRFCMAGALTSGWSTSPDPETSWWLELHVATLSSSS